jgi:hypothetical protein
LAIFLAGKDKFFESGKSAFEKAVRLKPFDMVLF